MHLAILTRFVGVEGMTGLMFLSVHLSGRLML